MQFKDLKVGDVVFYDNWLIQEILDIDYKNKMYKFKVLWSSSSYHTGIVTDLVFLSKLTKKFNNCSIKIMGVLYGKSNNSNQ